MARPKRQIISQEVGSYHILSRVAGGYLLFNDYDKAQFLKLLQRLASGFFVQIHAFCIMSNHFHILATCMEKEAKQASKDELLHRYRLMYPKSPGPPEGTYDSNGELIFPDEDGGIERLRKRLGSISRFVQELKQVYSRWYNKKYNRKGYLWGDRFKGVIAEKGVAQLNCSAYIDLNPIRAKIVKNPEDYPWSSLGHRVGVATRSNLFLLPLAILPTGDETEKEINGTLSPGTNTYLGPLVLSKASYDHYSNYREFVYKTGSVDKKGRSLTWPEYEFEVTKLHDQLGIYNRFGKRLKNFSEGLAFGSHDLIASFQKDLKRKHIRPRSFMGRGENCKWSFSTRVLRL